MIDVEKDTEEVREELSIFQLMQAVSKQSCSRTVVGKIALA